MTSEGVVALGASVVESQMARDALLAGANEPSYGLEIVSYRSAFWTWLGVVIGVPSSLHKDYALACVRTW